MTEEEAQAWLQARSDRETWIKLQRYVALLCDENGRQNLIGGNSVPQIWSRHILDSAQLADLAPKAENWLDVGSGPGLPGLVLAILTNKPVTLVEPRARRVAFLHAAISDLELTKVKVDACAIERLSPSRPYGAITARAYAALDKTFQSTISFSDRSTIWVLPRGKSGGSELEAAQQSWQGVFHVEQSVTDPEALIVVASQLGPKKR